MSHVAASTNSPCTKQPSSAGAGSSSGSTNLLTTKENSSESIGITCLRACLCKVPVKKPCVKKMLGREKELGVPVRAQACMNCIRAFKSLTHDPSGFSEGYADSAQ